jgi:hypothetical protein
VVLSPKDNEFLAQVKRQYDRRKKLGVLYVGTAVLFVIGAIWFYVYAEEQMRALLDVFGLIQTDDEPIKQAIDLAAFEAGLKVGGTLTGLAIGAGTLLGYGLDLLLGQRKERLLLELSEKIAKQRYGNVP